MSTDAQPPSPPPQGVWEKGWEGHELDQLRRMAKLTLPQKLAWLEQAHRLVRQLQKNNGAPDQKNVQP